MDFRDVLRVVLWLAPLTFLSLIQKIGRCGRDWSRLAEAILFVTNASYKRYYIELDILERDALEDAEAGDADELVEGELFDREAAVGAEEEAELAEQEAGMPLPRKRSRKKAFQTVMEARDRKFLIEYIVTTECRRIPWNKFFGNDEKSKYIRCLDPTIY